MKAWIEKLFDNPDLLGMGHDQRAADSNLGLGWLYYALGRITRPQRIVVIGSYRGFAPMVFARALADNLEDGRVLFIDPSLADAFWKVPASVREHFAHYGITNIDHRLMTTQQFIETEEYRNLAGIGLVFIDGYHSAEQAAFDYAAFENCLAPNGLILLHDSVEVRISGIYGPEKQYETHVVDFVAKLKQRADLQVFDFHYGRGVTLVRRMDAPLSPG
jgi:predicted O-methyltransferase YrrM